MTEAELLVKLVGGLLNSGCMVRMSLPLQQKFLNPAVKENEGLVVGAVKAVVAHGEHLVITVGSKYRGIPQDISINVQEQVVGDIALIEDMGTFILDDASTFHPDFTG